MSEEIDKKWISGFWRRIGSLFIDTIILGVVGIVLGLFLESKFIQIGAWGRLVGFSIALVYFGVMNSFVSQGQTVGKKVLSLRVVNSNNEPIGIGRSVLRYFIFSVPFLLNGSQFSNEAILSYLVYPLSLIIFGGISSILYLYSFNRITRQSLHDLVVGTFVVNANVERQEVGKVWNVHLIVAAALFLAAAIIPVFTSRLAESEPFKDMLPVQAALSKEPNVTNATISSGWSTFSTANKEKKTTTYVSSQIFLSKDSVNDVELARRMASIVVSNYSEALHKDSNYAYIWL